MIWGLFLGSVLLVVQPVFVFAYDHLGRAEHDEQVQIAFARSFDGFGKDEDAWALMFGNEVQNFSQQCSYWERSSGIVLCGVYDGHGGKEVSRSLARGSLHADDEPLLQKVYNAIVAGVENATEAMVAVFAAKDAAIIRGQTEYDGIIRDKSGSTATVLCLDIQRKKVILANVGDSEAYLIRRNISYIPLTKVRKPNDEDEQARINAAGGIVRLGRGRSYSHGQVIKIHRMAEPSTFSGGVMMSRAFGDPGYKKYGMTATPDCNEYELTCEDAYIVLASDGIWSMLSPQDIANELCAVENAKFSLQAMPQLFVAQAGSNWTERRCSDDITIFILDLRSMAAHIEKDQCS